VPPILNGGIANQHSTSNGQEDRLTDEEVLRGTAALGDDNSSSVTKDATHSKGSKKSDENDSESPTHSTVTPTIFNGGGNEHLITPRDNRRLTDEEVEMSLQGPSSLEDDRFKSTNQKKKESTDKQRKPSKTKADTNKKSESSIPPIVSSQPTFSGSINTTNTTLTNNNTHKKEVEPAPVKEVEPVYKKETKPTYKKEAEPTRRYEKEEETTYEREPEHRPNNRYKKQQQKEIQQHKKRFNKRQKEKENEGEHL